MSSRDDNPSDVEVINDQAAEGKLQTIASQRDVCLPLDIQRRFTISLKCNFATWEYGAIDGVSCGLPDEVRFSAGVNGDYQRIMLVKRTEQR